MKPFLDHVDNIRKERGRLLETLSHKDIPKNQRMAVVKLNKIVSDFYGLWEQMALTRHEITGSKLQEVW